MFKRSILAVAAFAPVAAFAAPPDVTSVTTAVTDAGAAGAIIGAAVLAMIAGIKLWKWVRRAM